MSRDLSPKISSTNIDFNNACVLLWRYERREFRKNQHFMVDLKDPYNNPHYEDFINEINRIKSEFVSRLRSCADYYNEAHILFLGSRLRDMVLSIASENKDFKVSFSDEEYDKIKYDASCDALFLDVDLERTYDGTTYKEFYCFRIFSKLERFLKNKEMR